MAEESPSFSYPGSVGAAGVGGEDRGGWVERQVVRVAVPL